MLEFITLLWGSEQINLFVPSLKDANLPIMSSDQCLKTPQLIPFPYKLLSSICQICSGSVLEVYPANELDGSG